MNMKKQNAQIPIRKSHHGKNRRQTSLTTDYYIPSHIMQRKQQQISQRNLVGPKHMKTH
jgi:hypothetical protein